MFYLGCELTNGKKIMNDLNWNDYFDNDREAGGECYESPSEYAARVARVKAYNESLLNDSSKEEIKC